MKRWCKKKTGKKTRRQNRLKFLSLSPSIAFQSTLSLSPLLSALRYFQRQASLRRDHQQQHLNCTFELRWRFLLGARRGSSGSSNSRIRIRINHRRPAASLAGLEPLSRRPRSPRPRPEEACLGLQHQLREVDYLELRQRQQRRHRSSERRRRRHRRRRSSAAQAEADSSAEASSAPLLLLPPPPPPLRPGASSASPTLRPRPRPLPRSSGLCTEELQLNLNSSSRPHSSSSKPTQRRP